MFIIMEYFLFENECILSCLLLASVASLVFVDVVIPVA